MRVRADIVERIESFASVADHDLPTCERDGAHAPLGDVGEGHDGLETGFAHFCGVFFAGRSAHFNRDPRPPALNLSAGLLEWGARRVRAGEGR